MRNNVWLDLIECGRVIDLSAVPNRNTNYKKLAQDLVERRELEEFKELCESKSEPEWPNPIIDFKKCPNVYKIWGTKDKLRILEELKLQILAQNPMILGVPAPMDPDDQSWGE